MVGTDPGGSQLLRVGGSAIIGSTLTVASGSQTTVDIQATLAGGTARLKLNPTSNNYYTIETAGGTDALQFARGGSELMRISNVGNVGIGTTSPGSLLHVKGSGAGSGATLLKVEGTGTSGSITIATSTNGGNIGYANLGAGNASNIFYVTTGAGTIGSGIVMDNGGNVGIGTTSPIYTSSPNRGNLTINGSSDAILVLTSGSNVTSYGYLYYDGTNTALASSGALLFKPASTERMRIDTSGNVGINATPSGTYKLEVNGTLGVSGTISGTGTNTWALQSVGAAGSLVAGGWLYGVNNGLNFAPNGAGLVKRLTLSYYDTVNGVYHEALGYSNTTSAAGAVSLIPDGGSVTIGGTLGVTGATTLTGGTASNRGNTGSIASGVATTMFSVSGTNGLYLVVAYINNSGAPDYQASALVTVGGTASNVNITAQNGAAMVISASGTNIRVTQTAGSSQTV